MQRQLYNRYSSRSLLVPFEEPTLQPISSEERESYQMLLDLQQFLPSTAGAVIRMGKKFASEHSDVILGDIEPRVSSVLNPAPVLHRVHVGYSILIYFTTLVSADISLALKTA